MAGALQNWLEILRTQNLPADRAMDGVSRWLLITRASAIPITLFSGLIGILLAAGSAEPHYVYAAVMLLGLLAAHAAGNMINDYIDLERAVDGAESVRPRSAPHPVLAGLVSRKGLLLAIAAVILLDLGILLFLNEVRGWPVAAFALAGLFIAVFYIAPPVRLKYRGLGEPGAVVVWGPLMTGGTYYVTTGAIEPWVLVASLPYAILIGTVLMGRHLDHFDLDAAHGGRTLPVILGRERALFLSQELMISFFVLIGCLVLLGTLGVWALLCLAALPSLWRALRAFNRPRPASPPPDHPVWPLWYVASAFRLARSAGAWLVLGLFVDALAPYRLG